MKSQLYLWSRWVLYVGRSFDSQEHTHHAVQLSIGLDGALRLNKGTDQQTLLPGVIVNSEVSHSLLAEGQWVVSLYLEPESEDYERLIAYYPGEESGGFRALIVGDELKSQFLALLGNNINPILAKNLVEKLIGLKGVSTTRSLDLRVIKVLKYLEQNQSLNLPLEQLAKHVCLSPDRLAHLFRKEVGIPIRRFVLWKKCRLAAEAACRGKPLIYAAQEGGFTDSAHLTRSFQKLYGINPSFLFGREAQVAMYVD